MTQDIRTVLFDLDGTLADTAPDLTWALNVLLEDQGKETVLEETVRPFVSQGGRAIIKFGFGLDDEDELLEPLRLQLLDIYSDNIAQYTKLFDGMPQVLEYLESNGCNWGLVTNKPAYLTEPLMDQLHLAGRAVAIVSGDTTSHSKPHPEPVLYACELAGSDPAQCVFVGDDPRDIEAGKAAGTITLVAGFGYIPADSDPMEWGADGYLDTPEDLITWLDF